MADRPPILFYDGECGLCHSIVRWVVRHDRAGAIHFAPLQGSTYATLALANKPMDLSTIVFVEEGEAVVRGDAILGLLRHLGGPWPLLAACGRVVPRGLRDTLYRAIAARRRRFFGRANACDLPAPRHAGRFLP